MEIPYHPFVGMKKYEVKTCLRTGSELRTHTVHAYSDRQAEEQITRLISSGGRGECGSISYSTEIVVGCKEKHENN